MSTHICTGVHTTSEVPPLTKHVDKVLQVASGKRKYDAKHGSLLLLVGLYLKRDDCDDKRGESTSGNLDPLSNLAKTKKQNIIRFKRRRAYESWCCQMILSLS